MKETLEAPIIQIENVSFSYDGEPVLSNVNLTVQNRDFASIVGPNGGGKTTLLKIILGMEKPDSGRVKVFGQAPEKNRYRIGYVPQNADFDPKFPITVSEVVLTGRLNHKRWYGRYTGEDKQIVRKSLSEVGLPGLENRPFSRLSGGQTQRVLIARALASKPEVLLLDEPTANLDPQAERELYELLSTLNQRLTILLVSHDLNFVSSFVKSVICVNRKVAVHPTGDVPESIGKDIFGKDMRIILHDHLCECGDGE
jgi:zinc transport system ATP-binding protein